MYNPSLNVEITNRLTPARRPGHSVYNSAAWNAPNSFYEFREFNANTEEIKVMIDTAAGLYDGTGPDTQIQIWKKLPGAGQSYQQSVANTLYWGDGISANKWLNTLQVRIPYTVPTSFPPPNQNPYNFTPYSTSAFIIDNNGNAEQLIGTVLQLSSFYILDNTVVFTVTTQSGSTFLPYASEILVPGLQIFFPASSQVAAILGDTSAGVTLTVLEITGGIYSATVVDAGNGYSVGDYIAINQPSQTGSMGAQLQVTSINGSGGVTGIGISTAGNGYTESEDVPTSAVTGSGTGLTLDILPLGNQFSCATNYTGGPVTSGAIDAAGAAYSVGDTLVPLQPSQASASGAQFIVSSVSGGSTTSYNPTLLPGSVSVTQTGPGSTSNTSSVGDGWASVVPIGNVILQVQMQGSATAYMGGGAITAQYSPDSGTTWTNFGGFGYSSTQTFPSTPFSVSFSVANIDTVQVRIFATAGAGTGGSASATASITTAQIMVGSGAPGSVTGITLAQGGSGYVSQNGLATTTSGSGTGCTLDITVANDSQHGPITATDTPMVYSGGNPISNSVSNSAFTWPTAPGTITFDGSAVWINRGATVDDGIVYNWGIIGGTFAPLVDVEGNIGTWEANTYYTQWQVILDSNGNVQQLLTGGTSGPSSPTWSTSVGQTTRDGSVTWLMTQTAPGGWAATTQYASGAFIEETVAGTDYLFQLQPPSGVQFQGSNFPVYLWQCASQSGDDLGAAGEWDNGGNGPMALDGGQSLVTATYSGTADGLFYFCDGTVDVKNFPVSGNGTVGSGSTLFSANQNWNLGSFPTLIFPEAGNYTFTIGHQDAMFWGLGNGTISLDVAAIEIISGILTVYCNRTLDNVISAGISLTAAGLTGATFLNGKSYTVSGVSQKTFTATITHADYTYTPDTGTFSSSAGLTPSVVSGPMNWRGPYNFSTGTPCKGYTVMGANYASSSPTYLTDTYVVNIPSAGSYPVEMHHGFWFHSLNSPSNPSVSPALPGGQFYALYMVYSPPGGTTNYEIIPQAIADSSATTPTWPAFTTAGAPDYPSVTEDSGNYTWWNLGPVADFQWHASINYTTQTYIVDINSNKELPFESGVSGTVLPTFSLSLYGLTDDLPNLVWMNNGTVGSTPSGEISTYNGGWQYCVSLVNTLDDDVSNASPASVSTGNFFSATGVLVTGGLPAVPDPQADYVAIFRTQDGGDTFYLIPPPVSGNGNIEFTLPLSQYLAQGFLDTTLDTNLNFLLEAPTLGQNTPPPKGAINCAYHLNRMFVSVGNTVYWSTGPDTPIGNGNTGFDPDNFAEFPSLVKRIVPLNIGAVVHTNSDIYILTGSATASDPLISYPFLQRIGLLSYNALTVNGSVIYFMTTDRQVIELNVHSGVTQVGFQIADQFNTWNPADSYLTWHVNGSNDQALFVADGSTGWFRMTPTPAPETGLTWSPKADIVGGCGAVQSVETTPGNIQLLVAPTATGPILYRDFTTYADNGTPYPAYFTIGSLVLANPGQTAEIEFITTDSLRIGQAPEIGVLLGEISGNFEFLAHSVADPTWLPPSQTLYNDRFYLSQTKQPAVCRHLLVQVKWPAENAASELLTLNVFGGFSSE